MSYSIEDLIPQRAPIQMVDTLVSASEDEVKRFADTPSRRATSSSNPMACFLRLR